MAARTPTAALRSLRADSRNGTSSRPRPSAMASTSRTRSSAEAPAHSVTASARAAAGSTWRRAAILLAPGPGGRKIAQSSSRSTSQRPLSPTRSVRTGTIRLSRPSSRNAGSAAGGSTRPAFATVSSRSVATSRSVRTARSSRSASRSVMTSRCSAGAGSTGMAAAGCTVTASAAVSIAASARRRAAPSASALSSAAAATVVGWKPVCGSGRVPVPTVAAVTSSSHATLVRLTGPPPSRRPGPQPAPAHTPASATPRGAGGGRRPARRRP